MPLTKTSSNYKKKKEKHIDIHTREQNSSNIEHQTVKTDLLECNGRENLKPEGIMEKKIQFSLTYTENLTAYKKNGIVKLAT